MADTEINALPDAVVALGDFAHLNDISNSNASFRETIQNILALYDSLTATMSNKTLVAPALGTPASGVLTNCTGTATGLTAGDISASAKVQSLIIAVSDETTALTTGTGKVTFRMPYAFTLTDVRASVTTAPTTSGTLTVDINETASTILSTKLTIDVTEKTSETAATAAVISDSSLADDAEITIDIDAISGGATEAGLKVTLIGYKT